MVILIVAIARGNGDMGGGLMLALMAAVKVVD